MNHRLSPVVVLLFVLASSLRAELPSIRFDTLKPLGGVAGTTVEVEIGGADIEETKSLLFDHPGIASEPVEGKERWFRVKIAAEVPAGSYDARLVGRFGVSNPRLFAVNHGLQDVAEKEPNNDRATAQVVPLNSAVNGVCDGNGEDLFRFPAKQGQRITLHCWAGRLDSLLDATMTLQTADTGKVLASSSDYDGRDPFIDFIATADGEYVATVHDLSYRGGHAYRLLITDLPAIENVFPRAIQVGATAEITALGRNLPGGTNSAWTVNELPLAELKFSVTAPADIATAGLFRFLDHPTTHSVLPTAATCTLTGFQVAPPLPGVLNPRPMLVSEYPVVHDTEPNDAKEAAQSVTLPLVLSGRFDRPRDADWFEFMVEEAGSYACDVYCERIAGRADAYLVIFDEQGNVAGELDDFGHRMNAFDGHLRDPAGTINLAAKQKYRALVQDRYQRGGARYQYVLAIRKPKPDFYPAAIHSQNPGPGGTTIRRGGAAFVDLVVHHTQGFSGPITFTAENLPPGLHATPTTTSDTRGTFVFWAEENAPEWTGLVSLFATGKRGEETIRREVRPHTRVWNDPGMNSSRPTRQLALAIRDSAPFALQFAQEKVTAAPGGKVELALRLKRNWPEFKNDVTLQPLGFPGGFQMPNGSIAGSQTEVQVTITIPGNARLGDHTLVVLGQAQVPFAKDPQAKDRPNTLVSLPSLPLTVTVAR